jgi:hypothetical protein
VEVVVPGKGIVTPIQLLEILAAVVVEVDAVVLGSVVEILEILEILAVHGVNLVLVMEDGAQLVKQDMP